MKLAKALKEKNRMVGEIARIKNILLRENSRNEKSTSKIDRQELWEELEHWKNELVTLKAAIFRANAGIYQKIARIGELKDTVQWISGLDTQDGEKEITPFRGEPTNVVYHAFKTQEDVDKMTAELQKEIAQLQDDLDIYNATTDVVI